MRRGRARNRRSGGEHRRHRRYRRGGDDGHAGGTAGSGGTAGTGGGTIGGTGGGAFPNCFEFDFHAGDVELAIVGADAILIDTRVTAAVTVASVDSCGAVTCPSYFPGLSAGPNISVIATRIVLTGTGSQQWTLYLHITNMPSDFIKVGDAFDLTVDASVDKGLWGTISQTVVLSHGPELIVFAAFNSNYNGPRSPDLGAFQIDVADGGGVCDTRESGVCGYRLHIARVTVAGVPGGSGTVPPGQTGRIGWLSFTNGEFGQPIGISGCDSPARTLMAGFRLP